MAGVPGDGLLEAALSGDTHLIQTCLNSGADVTITNDRGQNALHLCAWKGHLEPCRSLVDAGVSLYELDAQGNMPLHIAVIHNRLHVLRFMYECSHNFARSLKNNDDVITADGSTFDEACAAVFVALPIRMLHVNDTPRFEKVWLREAYIELKKSLLHKYSCCLPDPDQGILDYALKTFDRRPENGVYVANTTYNPLKTNDSHTFVPVISASEDLSNLLYHSIRLHLMDVPSTLLRRTPLHAACEANSIDSHRDIIYFLVNECGCNVFLKDKLGKTPIEVLMQDRPYESNTPTASKLAEELIFAQRDRFFDNKTVTMAVSLGNQRDFKRDKILSTCREQAHMDSPLLWDGRFNAARVQRRYRHWTKLIDPETRSIFYAHSEVDVIVEREYDQFCWELSSITSEVSRYDALAFWVSYYCKLIRKVGSWSMLVCHVNCTEFFLNESTLEVCFEVPIEVDWSALLRNAHAGTELGVCQEWRKMEDEWGNAFYYNALKNLTSWERPPDAVATRLKDQLCYATYMNGNINHKIFTCDTCRLKNKSGDKLPALRMCEPCAIRCHSGHKGVRLLRTGFGRCGCKTCGSAIGLRCAAEAPSSSQAKLRIKADAFNCEIARKAVLDTLMPIVFAIVPKLNRNNDQQLESGWMLCRCAPTEASIAAARQMCKMNEFPSILLQHLSISETIEEREGWIRVQNPNGSGSLSIGDVVMCTRGNGGSEYGCVTKVLKLNTYKVLFDVRERNFHRSRLMLMNTDTFYFNEKLGQSVWSLANTEGSVQSYEGNCPVFGGVIWLCIIGQAVLRRTFCDYDEYIDAFSSRLFYINFTLHQHETAARVIQKLIRQKFNMAVPLDWVSSACTFAKPLEVMDEEKLLGAWAYLRRRSKYNGQFLDDNKENWEEYIDSKTSEYFYWNRARGQYRWEKPMLPIVKEIKNELEIGDSVLYRFTTGGPEEPCTIIKRRVDDSSGEDLYDVQHEDNKERVSIWVPRMAIKRIPMSLEDASFKKSEAFWVNQIKRQREAEERKVTKRIVQKSCICIDELDYRLQDKLVSEEDLQRFDEARKYLFMQEQLQMHELEEKEKADARALIVNTVVTPENGGVDDALVELTRSEVVRMRRATDLMIRIQDKVDFRKAQKDANDLLRCQVAEECGAEEANLRDVEAGMSSPRSLRRRKIVRELHRGMRRHQDGEFICDSGCKEWVAGLIALEEHLQKRCLLREVYCSLECGIHMTEQLWLVDNFQLRHEMEDCPNRLVYCPLQCLEWIQAKDVHFHVTEMCPKRPGKVLHCRLDCGHSFGGRIEEQLDAEEERYIHEAEDCELRMVRCTWRYGGGKTCGAMVVAKDRNLHRDEHIILTGVAVYKTPGLFTYKVPDKVTHIKIQVWGAGGGSGCFKLRRDGSGGGGAFIEAILNVHPRDTLELQVGEGGKAGRFGEDDLETSPDTESTQTWGVAVGGIPGGGIGYGGNACFACGGGGGYSMISKRTAHGPELLIIAGGGGGGGSIAGIPGAGIHGVLPGTRIDRLNGRQGGAIEGGIPGDAGGGLNSQWPATAGSAYQGGDGSEFGGGGGGGIFGGGGGGTAPGIGGGGGGGSSWVNTSYMRDYLSIGGQTHLPGGVTHGAPEAVGAGDWDKVGGVAGEGGHTQNFVLTRPGNNGAICIFKPGFY